MRADIESATPLRFADGAPVRAASVVAPFRGGWLVAQDDSTHAAWWREGPAAAVRVVDPVDGLDEFSSAAGTKHLKPDFEAAVAVGGADAVLLLGSGSSVARTRTSLVTADGFTVADLAPVYRDVAAALGIPPPALNLEGACVIGDHLRWFQRANPAAPTASVDVPLAQLLAAATGGGRVDVGTVRRYDLGEAGGVALAVTDAVTLPDGRILVSAAAEDTPNAVDDGPVAGSALVLLDDREALAAAAIPPGPAGPYKVEGLAVRTADAGGVTLLAVTDADDATAASERLELRLSW